MVISIIGMLASVVLVALNGARTQGNNSRIQQEVNQIRNALEISRAGDGTYPATSFTPSGLACHHNVTVNDSNSSSLAADIVRLNGGGIGTNAIVPNNFATQNPPIGFSVFTDANSNFAACGISSPVIPTKYAIYAAYGSGGTFTGYFCSDSSGKATTGTVTTWSAFWGNADLTGLGSCI